MMFCTKGEGDTIYELQKGAAQPLSHRSTSIMYMVIVLHPVLFLLHPYSSLGRPYEKVISFHISQDKKCMKDKCTCNRELCTWGHEELKFMLHINLILSFEPPPWSSRKLQSYKNDGMNHYGTPLPIITQPLCANCDICQKCDLNVVHFQLIKTLLKLQCFKSNYIGY